MVSLGCKNFSILQFSTELFNLKKKLYTSQQQTLKELRFFFLNKYRKREREDRREAERIGVGALHPPS